jgi:hypothetical protein
MCVRPTVELCHPDRVKSVDPAEENAGGWTAWRQDDNGNRYEVSRYDSRAEADAVAARIEARGHKQTYWVEPST